MTTDRSRAVPGAGTAAETETGAGASPSTAPPPSNAGSVPQAGTGRARWHRCTGLLPLAYLAAIVVVGFAHPFLPQWRWLLIHLLLLGAVTNAILIWSTHFTAAVLRIPAPPQPPRRGRPAGCAQRRRGWRCWPAAPTGRRWLGVAGAAAVFGAVCAHLAALAARLRARAAAPGSRSPCTTTSPPASRCSSASRSAPGCSSSTTPPGPRLVLFHAHVNLLGWITLTVLGTVLTLWPTMLRTRMADGAVAAARTALPVAAAGLALLAVGVLGLVAGARRGRRRSGRRPPS